MLPQKGERVHRLLLREWALVVPAVPDLAALDLVVLDPAVPGPVVLDLVSGPVVRHLRRPMSSIIIIIMITTRWLSVVPCSFLAH